MMLANVKVKDLAKK